MERLKLIGDTIWTNASMILPRSRHFCCSLWALRTDERRFFDFFLGIRASRRAFQRVANFLRYLG